MPQANALPSTIRTKNPLPRALPKDARLKVENAIEQHIAARDALIAFLDEVDGDTDREECDEDQDVVDEAHDPEPDRENTWHETHGRGGVGGTCGSDDDHEPSLAHTNDLNQLKAQKHLRARWDWSGLDRDLEAEHDGREPCCEDEGAQCEDEGAHEHHLGGGAA